MTRLVYQTSAFVLAASTLILGAQAGTSRQADDIRDAVLRLPYYGVFDAISFSYDKGTVTLEGYAYRPSLKSDAERAVRRVAGVDEVVNKIVELPVSSHDDDLRWRTFYAIYTNDFLSRYAPGGGLLWGHRHSIRRDLQLGLQPLGNYPIHIIVERGRIRLLGVVDTQADKTVAELAARGVPGSFGVENQLTIDTQ
ncbi:MAG TPA: BON domain-containing protein [Vicinamibacterales bacterium]